MNTAIQQRIGDILVARNKILPAQLEEALAKKTPEQKIGNVLVEMGFITEQVLVDTISEQTGIPSLDSDMFLIDPAVIELLPESKARRHHAVPLFFVDNELTVGMCDPLDLPAIDELTCVTGYPINPVVVGESVIVSALNEYYAVGKSLSSTIGDFHGDAQLIDGESSAVRTVNQIIFQAVKLGASDIHIEPQEHDCQVRYRIDGVLHCILKPERSLMDPIVSRLKILAKLDISEKRLPQDGRFTVTIGDKLIDIRFSTLPTIFGEKVVLRVLDKSSSAIGLHHIGLDDQELMQIHPLLTNPHGLLLVTGPTGSGKTTTLYSMLKHISTPEKNIITVEDPVEYQFAGINQVQVNSKVQLTFSRGLRSILRQDPDVIMVGEIRDEETASIAARAALTGHLVLSTLHTNDAISTVGRLVDMGIKPYLLASSLLGVVAQRLIRKVCDDCVKRVKPSAGFLNEFHLRDDQVDTIAVARGCNRCNQTGYRGRTAIFEILVMSDLLRSIIINSSSSVELQQRAEEEGLSSIRESAVRKMIAGISTAEEVRRVAATSGA